MNTNVTVTSPKPRTYAPIRNGVGSAGWADKNPGDTYSFDIEGEDSGENTTAAPTLLTYWNSTNTPWARK